MVSARSGLAVSGFGARTLSVLGMTSAVAAISSWASSSAPMTTTTSGKSSGHAYGNVWTYGVPDMLYNSSYQRDPLNNGHGITVKSRFSWYSPTSVSPLSPQTPTTTSTAWTFGRTDSGGMSTVGTMGRVKFQLCEVYDWSPDNCTVWWARDVDYR